MTENTRLLSADELARGGEYQINIRCNNCTRHDVSAAIKRGVTVRDGLALIECPSCGCTNLEHER